MRAKLTKSFVDSLEPDPDPTKRRTVWDTDLPSFGVTVTPPGTRSGGVKSYIVQYRLGGRAAKARRVTIGRHGREWQPSPAREEAREILRMVRRGVDPFEERRRRVEGERSERLARWEAEEQDERLAYPAIAEDFVKRYAKDNQPKSWQATERALNDLKRNFGPLRVDQITRDQIRRALERIKGRSPSAAIAAHKALRKLYNWAVAEQIIPSSAHPMLLMAAPAKANLRKRVLTSSELREVWFAADGMGYPFGSLIRSLMITGQRLRECANALSGEAHYDQGVWIIPELRMKRDPDDDRGNHLVPLNGLAIDLFKGLPLIAPPAGVTLKTAKRPFFTTTGDRPISGFSTGKARLDAAINESRMKAAAEASEEWDVEDGPMPHWTNHDLRRTMSTSLQALGVDLKIIDLLQDHRVADASKVARHYQHWDYYPEKTAAMKLWEQYLRGAIFGDKRYRKLVEKVDFKLLVPR